MNKRSRLPDMYFSLVCALCLATLYTGIHGKVAQREENERGAVKREIDCARDRYFGYLCRINPEDYPLIGWIIMRTAPPRSINSTRRGNPLQDILDDARKAGPRALCTEVGNLIDCQQGNYDEALEQCTFDGPEAIVYAVGRRALKRVESEVNKICNGEFGDVDAGLNCLANIDLLMAIPRKCRIERLVTNKRSRYEAELQCLTNVMKDSVNCGPEALQFVETLLNYVYDIYEAIKDNKSTGTPSLTGLDWLF